MNHSSVPDLCLLEIFDRVPLSKVITSVSLVCRRWNQLVHPSALSRRTELRLHIAENGCWVDRSKPNGIGWKVDYDAPEYQALLRPRLSRISRALQSVTSLSLRYSISIEDITNEKLDKRVFPLSVVDFILSFSPRLVKLRICSSAAMCFPILYQHINEHMLQLRELDLAIQFPQPQPLPIIKQLTHFRLEYHFNDIEELDEVVLNYLEEGCERLVSCKLQGNNIDFEDWLEVDPVVAKKITVLGDGLDGPSVRDDYEYNILKPLTSLFRSLTWVYLSAYEDCTVVQILDCMRTLTQLKEFHLRFEHEHIGDDQDSLDGLQLLTVRHPGWTCYLANHGQLLEWFNFSKLFPQINSVHIEHIHSDKCSLCLQEGKSPRDCIQTICDALSGGNNPELKHVKVEGYDIEDEDADRHDEIQTEWKL